MVLPRALLYIILAKSVAINDELIREMFSKDGERAANYRVNPVFYFINLLTNRFFKNNYNISLKAILTKIYVVSIN